MIFVTLGTCPFQFERLIKIADEYAAASNEDVFLQTGYTKLGPRNCRYKDFLSKDEFISQMKKAEVVIAHAGFGVTLDALKMCKKIILVPRCRELNEHTDNHQHELAKLIAEQGRALVLYENCGADQLLKAVEQAKGQQLFTGSRSKETLVRRLSAYIARLSTN